MDSSEEDKQPPAGQTPIKAANTNAEIPKQLASEWHPASAPASVARPRSAPSPRPAAQQLQAGPLPQQPKPGPAHGNNHSHGHGRGVAHAVTSSYQYQAPAVNSYVAHPYGQPYHNPGLGRGAPQYGYQQGAYTPHHGYPSGPMPQYGNPGVQYGMHGAHMPLPEYQHTPALHHSHPSNNYYQHGLPPGQVAYYPHYTPHHLGPGQLWDTPFGVYHHQSMGRTVANPGLPTQAMPQGAHEAPGAVARLVAQLDLASKQSSRPLVVDGSLPVKDSGEGTSSNFEDQMFTLSNQLAQQNMSGLSDFDFGAARHQMDRYTSDTDADGDLVPPNTPVIPRDQPQGLRLGLAGVNAQMLFARLRGVLVDQKEAKNKAAEDEKAAQEAEAEAKKSALDKANELASKELREAWEEMNAATDLRALMASHSAAVQDRVTSDQDQEEGPGPRTDAPEWPEIVSFGPATAKPEDGDNDLELSPLSKAAAKQTVALLGLETSPVDDNDKHEQTTQESTSQPSVSRASSAPSRGLTEVQLAAQRAHKTMVNAAARERATPGSLAVASDATGSSSAGALVVKMESGTEPLVSAWPDISWKPEHIADPRNWKIFVDEKSSTVAEEKKPSKGALFSDPRVALPLVPLPGPKQPPANDASRTKVKSVSQPEGPKLVPFTWNPDRSHLKTYKPPVEQSIPKMTRLINPPPGFEGLEPRSIEVTPPMSPSNYNTAPRIPFNAWTERPEMTPGARFIHEHSEKWQKVDRMLAEVKKSERHKPADKYPGPQLVFTTEGIKYRKEQAPASPTGSFQTQPPFSSAGSMTQGSPASFVTQIHVPSRDAYLNAPQAYIRSPQYSSSEYQTSPASSTGAMPNAFFQGSNTRLENEFFGVPGNDAHPTIPMTAFEKEKRGQGVNPLLPRFGADGRRVEPSPLARLVAESEPMDWPEEDKAKHKFQTSIQQPSWGSATAHSTAGSQHSFSGSPQSFSGFQQSFAGSQQSFAGTRQQFSNTQHPFSGTQQPYSSMSTASSRLGTQEQHARFSAGNTPADDNEWEWIWKAPYPLAPEVVRAMEIHHARLNQAIYANSKYASMSMAEMEEDVNVKIIFANFCSSFGISRAEFEQEYRMYRDPFEVTYVPKKHQNQTVEEIRNMRPCDLVEPFLNMMYRSFYALKMEKELPEDWKERYRAPPPKPRTNPYGAIGDGRPSQAEGKKAMSKEAVMAEETASAEEEKGESSSAASGSKTSRYQTPDYSSPAERHRRRQRSGY